MLFGHLCQPPLTKTGNKYLDRLLPSQKLLHILQDQAQMSTTFETQSPQSLASSRQLSALPLGVHNIPESDSMTGLTTFDVAISRGAT